MASKSVDQAEIQQALADWRSNRAYVDGRGNYHVKSEGRPSGPIAPWNKAAKRTFATVSDLHKASGWSDEETETPFYACYRCGATQGTNIDGSGRYVCGTCLYLPEPSPESDLLNASKLVMDRLEAWAEHARMMQRRLTDEDAEPYRNQAENYEALISTLRVAIGRAESR